MTDPRRTTLRALAVLACALAPRPAFAGSTFDDVWRRVLAPQCDSCHGPNGDSSSGFLVTRLDANGSTEKGWYDGLVGTAPTNAAAQALGKLRVTPYQPWNSYLVDKLTGHLKRNEGRGMPFKVTGPSLGYVHECPGAIDKIVRWIVNGSSFNLSASDPGDTSPGTINCDALAQPGFTPPTPSDPGAVVLSGDSFTVASAANAQPEVYEGEHTSRVTVAAGLAAGRIQIAASAGTEYVVVTRNAEAAPLVVARGAALDVALPTGVAVPLGAGDTITIRQRIRNDYWVKLAPGSYVNQTVGQVAVVFHPAAAADHLATPFADATGTQALFVPPRSLGGTGGVWTSSSPVGGAIVGLWSDQRMIEASVADAAGRTLASTRSGDPLTSGYVTLADAGTADALAYQCLHSNAFTTTSSQSYSVEPLVAAVPGSFAAVASVNRPMKYACIETALPTSVNLLGPLPPAGKPAILGASPAIGCEKSIHELARTSGVTFGPRQDDSECTGSAVDSCAPANLVGGGGVQDGRCTLVGLAW